MLLEDVNEATGPPALVVGALIRKFAKMRPWIPSPVAAPSAITASLSMQSDVSILLLQKRFCF